MFVSLLYGKLSVGQEFMALTPVSAVPTAAPATCFLSTYHQSHPYEAVRMEKTLS